MARQLTSADHKARWDGWRLGTPDWWEVSGFTDAFPFNGGATYYDAFKESVNSKAMYEIGYGWLAALLKMWQASGDNTYIEQWLDLVEPTFANKEPADQYYARTGIFLGGFFTPNDAYNSWYNEPSFDVPSSAKFTLENTGVVSGGFTVNYEVVQGNGSATKVVDFPEWTGSVDFDGTDGEIKDIYVGIRGSSGTEQTETFYINITSIDKNVGINTPSAIIKILPDDDTDLGVFVSGFSINEDAGTATFQITSEDAVTGGFTIDYAITDINTDSSDFSAVTSSTGSISFNGTTNEIQTVALNINDDNLAEAKEYLLLTLSNLSTNDTVITDAYGIGEIIDNDNPIDGVSFQNIVGTSSEPLLSANVFSTTLDEYRIYTEQKLGKFFGCGAVQINDNNVGAQYSLWENIYMKFVANGARIVYKYPTFLDTTSANGQTYRTRFESIVATLENDVYDKWTNRTLDSFVYLTDRHRSSHLVSVAICLHAITGTQKYFDFANSYFTDWSVRINGTKSGNIEIGENFWTDFTTVNVSAEVGDRYEYFQNFRITQGITPGYQDQTHAGGGEAQTLQQAYEEGVYGITEYQMNTYLNSIKYGWIDWDQFLATGDRFTYFRVNQTERATSTAGSGGNFQSMLTWLEYDETEELLEWQEGLRVNAATTWKGNNSAFAYYASRKFEDALVYPSIVNGDIITTLPDSLDKKKASVAQSLSII